MKYLALIVLMIILSGCSSSRFVSRDSVEIHRDDFSSEIEYLGITQQSKELSSTDFGDDSFSFFLRSFKDIDTGEVNHQIYVDVYYMTSNWKFYQRASFEGGTNADFVMIGRNVVTCTHGLCVYNEVFGIQIPNNALYDNIDGLSVKAYAQSGHELIVKLSEEQIQAQLQALEK